jgi:hypothetical protein
MKDPLESTEVEKLDEADFGVVRLEDDGRQRALDDPSVVKKIINGFFIVCVLLLFLDAIFLPPFGIAHRHLSFEEGVFQWETVSGFYCVYGLVACVLLVLVAKQLRKLLMRNEDYYDR